MLMASVISGILVGLALAVRIISAALAVLLITRSFIEKIASGIPPTRLRKLYDYTDIFITPVRRFLPPVIVSDRTDFSPLVTALAVLFLGLGVSVFIETIAVGFF